MTFSYYVVPLTSTQSSTSSATVKSPTGEDTSTVEVINTVEATSKSYSVSTVQSTSRIDESSTDKHTNNSSPTTTKNAGINFNTSYHNINNLIVTLEWF